MTKSVDALSILRDAEYVLRRDHYKAIPDDLRQARDDFAMLIEAVDKLFGADMESCMEMDGKQDQLEAVQLAKLALARVKGA
ncbi:hypothetical protein [Stenotrophomonas muris]|uniref:hypothetical protein n=1 Tax=Stenotrophomonas muris TaxID=2963283 RepID=UPI00383B7A8E